MKAGKPADNGVIFGIIPVPGQRREVCEHMRDDLDQLRAFRMAGHLNFFPRPQFLISLRQLFINAGLQLANLISDIQPGITAQMAQFLYLAFQSSDRFFEIKKMTHETCP